MVPAEEAHRIFNEAFQPAPLGEECISLDEALGRVLSRDVISPIDVPYFDRSNLDGFAVRAQDTFGAEENSPVLLGLTDEIIHTSVVPQVEITEGMASTIATGGVIPRGADGIVMVENTQDAADGVEVYKPVVPGGGISYAGTDIGAGETVLHRKTQLTSREMGTLAAMGLAEIYVYRKPRVAIISTGDEIIAPGEAMILGKIYDSNATIVANALREQGCEPIQMGIVPDDEAKLEEILKKALAYDFVLLSGGTSKGAGDLNYVVVERIGNPGILVHGVALKPGKPLCLALMGKTPLAILPGFPTSAVFTFHEFIVPVLRIMAGLGKEKRADMQARVPMRVNSEKGRTEFLLVNLVEGTKGFAAYPMGKGSGSVTAFSGADGFISIDRNTEILDEGEIVDVTLIGRALSPADLIIIGSQCVGLDFLISQMSERGFRVKFIAVGSQGGLVAAKRQECDAAGMHLLDEKSGVYNQPFLNDKLTLVKGYGRKQGLVYRKGDERFEGKTLKEALANAIADEKCLMLNRNRGSGTRVLIDKVLEGAKPAGVHVEAKSHNAVAAAVKQNRVDWGVAIENVASMLDLGFIPIMDEEYDFALPTDRLERPAVQAFLALLKEETVIRGLKKLGMSLG